VLLLLLVLNLLPLYVLLARILCEVHEFGSVNAFLCCCFGTLFHAFFRGSLRAFLGSGA
tara:strand:+ start:1016 stop:1192 length:177 start_codon:yes stop_codon:yes gene_type:complete